MPKKTGYDLLGYYDSTSGTTQYYPSTGVSTLKSTFTAATTLYAKWDAITFYVAFNGNDSNSGTMSNQTFTYGTNQTLTKNTFKKTGYDFANWNTISGGTGTSYTDGQSVGNLTTTSGGTVNLYAIWSLLTYTITYTLNGGTNSSSNPTTYNVETTVTFANPTKTGYTSNGWFTESSFTNAITTTENKAANLTLYAKFTANKYTVVFDANGGTGTTMATQTFTYGDAQNLSENTYTKTDYTFSGWATTSSGTVAYADKASVKNLATSGSITLYAKWE